MRWILAVFVFTWTCAASAEPTIEGADCKLHQLASVNLQIGEQVLVPVKLQTLAGFMELQTSFAYSSLSERTARKLGLPIVEMNGFEWDFDWLDGRPLRRFARFDALQIGAFNVGANRILVAPRPRAQPPGLDAAVIGILGMDLFRHLDFELDLAHGRLTLFSQAHCPGKVVYWADRAASSPLHRDSWGVVSFPIELEGKLLEATLSVSAPMSSIRTDVTRKYYGFDTRSPGVSVELDRSGRKRAHYRAMQLTSPGLIVINPKLALNTRATPCPIRERVSEGYGVTYMCSGIYPLELGRDVLRTMRIYFATRENVVYFTAADAVKDP